MPKANEIKKGGAVRLNDKLLIVKDIVINNPSARGAATLYKLRFSDVRSGQKVEQTFKGDDMIEAADLERRNITFSYQEGDTTIFMDSEDYTQHTFNNETIADELLYITEDIQGLILLLSDGEPIALELPQSVDLVITETDPSIKGASATSRTKPASFSTGLMVQVPEYIAPGERVKIHTTEKRFMGRAE